MTTHNVPIRKVSEEQAAQWLQQHIMTWTGYAFALAQQANLALKQPHNGLWSLWKSRVSLPSKLTRTC